MGAACCSSEPSEGQNPDLQAYAGSGCARRPCSYIPGAATGNQIEKAKGLVAGVNYSGRPLCKIQPCLSLQNIQAGCFEARNLQICIFSFVLPSSFLSGVAGNFFRRTGRHLFLILSRKDRCTRTWWVDLKLVLRDYRVFVRFYVK